MFKFIQMLGLLVFCGTTTFAETKEPETVITSTAIDEIGNQNSPRPIEKINLGDQVQEKSLSDAMNTIGGVQMRLLGSPTISLRGSQSSTRVLVLQDDVPLNFLDGTGFNPLFIPVENLGSASLLKGPASSVFGHDAMAGAIGFNSRELKGFRFFSSVGSFQTTEAFAGYGHQGRTNYQITAYQGKTAGDFPFSSSQVGNGVRNRNDDETIRATVLASGDLSTFDTAPIYWKTFHLFARGIGSTPDAIDSNFPQSYNNTGHLHSLLFLIKSGNNFSVKSTSTAAILETNYNGSYSKAQSLRQGLRIQNNFGSVKFSLFDDATWDSFTASYFPGGQNATLNEAGAQIQFPIAEKVEFTAGARADTSSFTNYNPTVGIQGDTEAGYQYYINYSQGYHPPSLSQKYGVYAGFQGNTSLRTEKSSEIDLGFTKNISNMTVKFAAFDRTMTDLIENRSIGGGIYTPQNVGRGQADGFEISGSGWMGAHKLELQVAYLQSKNTDTGDPLLLSPQVQASFSIWHQLPWFDVKLEDTYWGQYYDRNGSNQLVGLGPWNTLNAYLSKEVLDGVRLNVSFFNLFDQARQLTLAYPEPQRSYKLTLEGVF